MRILREKRYHWVRVSALFWAFAALGWSACLSADTTSDVTGSSTLTPLSQTSACLTNSPWVPHLGSFAAQSAHLQNFEDVVTRETFSGSAKLTGLAQAWDPAGAGGYAEFAFTVGSLGPGGSVTLVGRPTAIPTGMAGSAFPVLVKLTHVGSGDDLINLASACGSEGMFTCSGGSCSANPNCAPRVTGGELSAYLTRAQWEQHQLPAFGYSSVNRFPSCGSGTGCGFVDGEFLTGGGVDVGQLRPGTYVARYVPVASNYASVARPPVSIQVDVVKKTDTVSRTSITAGQRNGSMDLNVILVGSTNIADSRTTIGKRNLNMLIQKVAEHFSAHNPATEAGTGVTIGTVSAYEFGCSGDMGDAFASLSLDQVEELFASGTLGVSSSSEGKALNVFLVSDITQSGGGFTILGVSGGIVGSPVNGTGSSGLVISTFNKLDEFNVVAGCHTTAGANPDTVCPASEQAKDFLNLADTVSHEIGHFLGLNHPSEKEGTSHDVLLDTPTCGAVAGTVSHSSCLSVPVSGAGCDAVCSFYNHSTGTYCAAQSACQFNHVMWFTEKNYRCTSPGSSNCAGDGALFSSESASQVNFSSFIY